MNEPLKKSDFFNGSEIDKERRYRSKKGTSIVGIYVGIYFGAIS